MWRQVGCRKDGSRAPIAVRFISHTTHTKTSKTKPSEAKPFKKHHPEHNHPEHNHPEHNHPEHNHPEYKSRSPFLDPAKIPIDTLFK
jgi:hypothetical protein